MLGSTNIVAFVPPKTLTRRGLFTKECWDSALFLIPNSSFPIFCSVRPLRPFLLALNLRRAFYSLEVITPTTSASPGLTGVAYLRPRQMSLSTLAWGGCRGREFPRTRAANISAIHSRVKQDVFSEASSLITRERYAVEKYGHRAASGNPIPGHALPAPIVTELS